MNKSLVIWISIVLVSIINVTANVNRHKLDNEEHISIQRKSKFYFFSSDFYSLWFVFILFRVGNGQGVSIEEKNDDHPQHTKKKRIIRSYSQGVSLFFSLLDIFSSIII